VVILGDRRGASPQVDDDDAGASGWAEQLDALRDGLRARL
jgi:hypothetical protein